MHAGQRCVGCDKPASAWCLEISHEVEILPGSHFSGGSEMCGLQAHSWRMVLLGSGFRVLGQQCVVDLWARLGLVTVFGHLVMIHHLLITVLLSP